MTNDLRNLAALTDVQNHIDRRSAVPHDTSWLQTKTLDKSFILFECNLKVTDLHNQFGWQELSSMKNVNTF